jgi:hypothetical protein
MLEKEQWNSEITLIQIARPSIKEGNDKPMPQNEGKRPGQYANPSPSKANVP